MIRAVAVEHWVIEHVTKFLVGFPEVVKCVERKALARTVCGYLTMRDHLLVGDEQGTEFHMGDLESVKIVGIQATLC